MGVTEDIIKSRLTLIKHSDNGETQIETPEVVATFEMYLTRSGSFAAADPDERDILTVDGCLMLPTSLSYGKGYKLLEIQTAPPYFLGNEAVYFDVDGSETVVTVTKYNMPQRILLLTVLYHLFPVRGKSACCQFKCSSSYASMELCRGIML